MFRVFDSAHAFLEACGDYLAKHEVQLNRLASGARSLAANPREDSTFLGFYDSAGRVSGVALFPGVNATLLLSELGDDAIESLIEHFSNVEQPVAEVYGPRAAVERFQTLYSARHAIPGTLIMAFGLFSADRIEVPPPAGGRLVVAETSHRDTVRAWLEAFHREALPLEPFDPIKIDWMVDLRIAGEDVGLWFDDAGVVRSMVARNRETDHGACISWVYTPPEARGRGFGARVTASFSARLLERGARFVFLYTDLAYPISNHLYPRLGFRRVGEDARVHFAARKKTSSCSDGLLPLDEEDCL